MFFVAALSSVLSQEEDLTLECFFGDTWQYECFLTQIEVLDPTQNVVFVGEHTENRTDDDVRIVRISASTTPFIIQQLFTTFPNIDELYIANSHLESIEIPDTVHLSDIEIYGNNITRLENGTFDGQASLINLVLRDNNILEIDEDAFAGLGALVHLNLLANHVEELAPRTFQSLTNLTSLDMERNRLRSISDELFSNNPLLTVLDFEANLIEEISPRLLSNFNSLLHFDLTGNICVGRNFYLDSEDDFSFISLHNALRTCYNNFIGEVPVFKRVILEFLGPLRLFDEFGNIVASL